MRRLLTAVLFCAASAVLVTARSVSADDSMSSGSASLPKNHQYLIGTWNCTVKLAAMEGQPAMTDHGVLTFSISPNMTLHSHVAAKDYMSDSYQGYDSKTKTHWLDSADAFGNVTLETSKDGMVFTGTSWQGGTSTPVRDTQSKISDTKIRDVTDEKENGKWMQLADAVCTKT
jgi:hypothetical protein